MKKHLKTAIILMIITLALGLVTGCGETAAAKSSEAALSEITVSNRAPDKIPEPISPSLLSSGDFALDPIYYGTIYLAGEDEMNPANVTVKISSGAKAELGLAQGFDVPETFKAATRLIINRGDSLYVKVTAEDGTINYYRFAILTMSANSSLSTLTVQGKSAAIATPPGTAWNDKKMGLGIVSLGDSKKTNATVAGTPGYRAATIAYAKVTGAGEPAFNDTTVYNFEDGDFLYVMVTAENGTNVSYYKFEVQIGRDATLASVNIGGADADTLGTPKVNNWGNGNWVTGPTANTRGTCQADKNIPAEGFVITITPTDDEATCEWAVIEAPPKDNAADAYNEPAYNSPTTYKFPLDASDIVIRVTSSNASKKSWYRIRFIAKNYAEIYKGTPANLNLPADPESDQAWGKADWLYVNRVNMAESEFLAVPWFSTEEGQHTSAKVKVLWDDDGLYAYWDVAFKSPYTDDTGEKTRNPSLSGSAEYKPNTDPNDNSVNPAVPSGAHTYDSVEFFVNERYQKYKTGNYGNQYRVGLPNSSGVTWLSGERGNAPATFNPITAFQLDKKVTVSVNGSNGYKIVMFVPWVGLRYAAADVDSVFNTDGTVKAGTAEIGLELQVNACAVAGTRDGILTWNGVTSQAYQNVKSFGIVTLKETKE